MRVNWPPQKVALTPGKRVLFLTKDLDLIKQQLTAEANTHLKQPVSDFETLLRDAHTHDDGTVDK